MNNENFDDITQKCKSIIQKNNPIESINKISKLNLQNGKKIEKDYALKIYKIYACESIKYGPKYNNNINLYKKDVSKNIKIATLYCTK
jgi:transposase-like protein